MDATRYTLRDLEESDYEGWAALQTRIYPDHPMSVGVLRQLLQADEPPVGPLPRYAVEERSSQEIVAVAGLERNPYQWDPTRPWIFGEVHPEHRGRGIGSRLYEVLVAAAQRRGATGLRASAREEDPTGLRFLVRRRFEERRRSWRSVLDIASADTARLPTLRATLSAVGIEVTTLEKEGPHDPSVLRRVHDLDTEVGADVPHVGAYTPVSFEEFQSLYVRGTAYLPEAWILAKREGEYIGMTSALREPAQPEVLQQMFTGVRAAFRRKKVAETLKLSLIDYARTHGYAQTVTSNDSKNEAMWSLNRRLGYRKASVRVHLECAFDRAPGA